MTFCGLGRQRLTLALIAVGILAGCEIKKAPVQSTSSTDGAKSTVNEGGVKADSATSKKGDEVAETISAEGSSTVYPICQAFAVEFEKKSNQKVSVGQQGTGGGYKKFANRQADIWNASRPIDPKEVEELKSKGIDWFELTIAVDGIVIAVHPDNKWCSQLTCGQLKQIWEPDSKVQTWKDLDPNWPDEPLLLYGADTDSGTFEYFTEVINGKKKASNTRYTPSSNDNILVAGIASNKGALGYIPFGYYVENTEKLKLIAISPTKEPSETPAPYVVPTEESILSGEYAPLSRPLFMYANNATLLSRPEVADFLRFAVSEEAQDLIQLRGFVRVKDDLRKQMQEKIESVFAGKSAAKTE